MSSWPPRARKQRTLVRTRPHPRRRTALHPANRGLTAPLEGAWNPGLAAPLEGAASPRLGAPFHAGTPSGIDRISARGGSRVEMGVALLTALGAVGLGGVLLAFAADQFVIGAARIALLRRLSPLAVGVVIVGFGTSAPELLVSVLAATAGDMPIAVGNIVGSNIANLTLLLGLGAVLLPLTVASKTVRREAPLTVAATVAFGLAVQSGIAVWEGAVLLALMAAVIWRVMRTGSSDSLGAEADQFADAAAHNLRTEVIRTLLGLIGTLAGAQLLLTGALDLATLAGLSEGFVGATLVAVGTSLPELVTVVQSARRREGDLILGNLLGSNLFNALAVGGMVGTLGTGAAVGTKLSIVAAGIAVAVAGLAWMMMRTGRTVSRREGALLVAIYPLIVLALY